MSFYMTHMMVVFLVSGIASDMATSGDGTLPPAERWRESCSSELLAEANLEPEDVLNICLGGSAETPLPELDPNFDCNECAWLHCRLCALLSHFCQRCENPVAKPCAVDQASWRPFWEALRAFPLLEFPSAWRCLCWQVGHSLGAWRSHVRKLCEAMTGGGI